ncbi:peptidase inhibitor family I36 protein [Micromonospora sp. NPDC049102]|uniref:peptidase inhibitor family I36 protein n=1 Tax=Micromonospora sp. NPDC049102 TaxID=3364265 RepID=UPI003721ABD1
MRIAKRVGATLTAFGLALGGVTIATTTSAQASASQCKSGQVCLFEGANFSGGVFRVNGCDTDLGDNTFDNGNRVVDHTSSIINKSGSAVFAYEFPDPYRNKGYELGVAGGNSLSNLSNVQVLDYRTGTFKNVNFDDNASAVC